MQHEPGITLAEPDTGSAFFCALDLVGWSGIEVGMTVYLKKLPLVDALSLPNAPLGLENIPSVLRHPEHFLRFVFSHP